MLLNVRIPLNGFLAMKLLLIFVRRLWVMEHVSSEHYLKPLLVLKQIIMQFVCPRYSLCFTLKMLLLLVELFARVLCMMQMHKKQ
uniref:Uncharacterized protein n=1 Tax=Amphimedon queenslandica TaxID=400682 RepID=A0A1X7U2J1_AMPQE